MKEGTRKFISIVAIVQTALFPVLSLAQTASPTGTISVTPELLLRRGAVLDQKTGLAWARCLVGQQWDGKACVGTPQPFSGRAAAEFARAQKTTYAGLPGWTVPTIAELVTLRTCSTGSSPYKANNDPVFIPSGTGGPDLKVTDSCSSSEIIAVAASTFFTPNPIDEDALHPSNQLVSYSYRDQSRDAWYLVVRGGRILNEDSQLPGYIRLVLREVR